MSWGSFSLPLQIPVWTPRKRMTRVPLRWCLAHSAKNNMKPEKRTLQMCKEQFLQPVDCCALPNILSAQHSLSLGFACPWRKHAPMFYTKTVCIFCTLSHWPWSKIGSLFSTYSQAAVIITLCAWYSSSEITHFSWRLIWQRESRKTDLFTLSGWQHVDCLTFVKKKIKKRHSVKWFPKHCYRDSES